MAGKLSFALLYDFSGQQRTVLVTRSDDGYFPGMRFFNPHDDIAIAQRKLPHWSQAGTVVFITWRTQDSMPQGIIDAWRADRNRWLNAHAIDPTQEGWKMALHELPPKLNAEFHERFTSRWHDELDACHGACVLRRPDLAKLVAESLLRFNNDRYEMMDFVVMPNHLHVLATFPDKQSMLAQCEPWKHFTATRINSALDQKERFWQQDAFDHLVRHEAQFARLKCYIAENPMKSRLAPGEYVHRRHSESDPQPRASAK